jgi:DNA-binding CsgD family transcriptional regulator
MKERVALRPGQPTTAAVLAARPEVSVAEALWVVRAGLEFEDAAKLIGVEVADIMAALEHNERHAAAFDALGEPDSLIVRHAKAVSALAFYGEDSYHERRYDGGPSYIEGDHGYLARKALGTPNEYDRAIDAREAAAAEQAFAAVLADFERGELSTRPWSEVSKLFDRVTQEIAERNAATAEAFGRVMARLLERGTMSEAAAWLFARHAELQLRPIDVLEHEGPDRLLKALADADVASPVVSATHPNASPRELQIIRLVAVGLTAKEIARRLGSKQGTIEDQIQSLMRRWGAKSRSHAVAIGFRNGDIR